MVWVPIALASAGLIVTFNAGMWNIGIEGQIIMGAITAAWVAREVSASRPILIVLTVLAGASGVCCGACWSGSCAPPEASTRSSAALASTSSRFRSRRIWSLARGPRRRGFDQRHRSVPGGLPPALVCRIETVSAGGRYRARRPCRSVASLPGHAVWPQAQGRRPQSAELVSDGDPDQPVPVGCLHDLRRAGGDGRDGAGTRVPREAHTLHLRQLRIPGHPGGSAGPLPADSGGSHLLLLRDDRRR